MTDDSTHVSIDEIEPNPEKPGDRRELSPSLDVEAFNLNVAVLSPGDRLSQSHYHYHENQRELFYVIAGQCRVETTDRGFDLGPDEVVAFAAGDGGAHLVYNPFGEPCKLLAIGWPADGRFPVHTVAETEELLSERYGDGNGDVDGGADDAPV